MLAGAFQFKNLSIITLLSAIFAIFLQIQISLFADGDYLGLRVNLADFLLPFLGISVMISILFKKTNWPEFENSLIPLSLLFIVITMTAALLNGYKALGYWSSWAYLNKYIGLFILLSYFALGSWIASNAKYKEKSFKVFGLTSSIFFTAIVALSFLGAIILKVFDTSIWLEDFPWDGLAANRNVFMIIAMFCMVFIEITRKSNPETIPKWLYVTFWILTPVFTLYNASRSGWIIGALFLIYMLISKPKNTLKSTLPLLILGFALMYGVFHYIAIGDAADADELHLLNNVVTSQSPQYYGDQKRWIAVEDGLQMYRESNNPILGAGLGAYKDFQIEKRGEFIDVMDFSVLWLLSETGGLGLSAFLIFFLLALRKLYIEGYQNNSSFHQTVFLFLLAMILISVLHELLYTRLLWFVLGLGLTIPTAQKSEET